MALEQAKFVPGERHDHGIDDTDDDEEAETDDVIGFWTVIFVFVFVLILLLLFRMGVIVVDVIIVLLLLLLLLLLIGNNGRTVCIVNSLRALIFCCSI